MTDVQLLKPEIHVYPNISQSSALGNRNMQQDRMAIVELTDGYLLAVFDGFFTDEISEHCAVILSNVAKHLDGIFIDGDNDFDFLRSICHTLSAEAMHSLLSGSTASLVHIINSVQRADVAIIGDSPVIVIDAEENRWVSPSHNVRTNESERARILECDVGIHNGYISLGKDIGVRERCLQLTRAIGAEYFADFLLHEPECFSFKLGPRSVIALMTDGVYDNKKISRVEGLQVMEIIDAETIVNDAVRNGTSDNVTAIVWHA